jgi:hypothetical protein
MFCASKEGSVCPLSKHVKCDEIFLNWSRNKATNPLGAVSVVIVQQYFMQLVVNIFDLLY